MWKPNYLELLKTLLNFDFVVLCPWKNGSDNLKLSKLFRACFGSPLISAVIMALFVYYEWNDLSMITLAENLATAIAFARSCGYATLVKKYYRDYKQQVDEIIVKRTSLPSDLKERSMTERYCKTEFILAVFNHLLCHLIFFLLVHALVFFSPNPYQLPFNCYITFMPLDGFLFAWELNYLFFTVTLGFTGILLASFIPLPFILMNHSCWWIDMALITAEDLNENLKVEEDIRDPERVARTNENLNKFVERCETFVEWQNKNQGLLFWYFNLEFQVQSTILCFSIYVLSFTFSGGKVLMMLAFCATQLFILCWMGTRVTSRIDKLSFEISKNWYLMTPSQRKTLHMVLHWTQNMKSFSGMFRDVSLETCKAIFEASYSFYAFLKSTNGN